MNRFFAVFVFVLFLLSNTVFAEDKNDLKSAVRIVTDHGIGSGTVFVEDEFYYYILTCGHLHSIKDHVVAYGLVKIDFFDDDEFKLRIYGDFIRSEVNIEKRIDLAIIRFGKAAVHGYNINILKLAPEDTIIKKGQTIHSTGFPFGNWPMSWGGKIDTVFEKMVAFSPNPFSGQSGSSIRNTDDLIIGVIVYSVNTITNNGRPQYMGTNGYSLGNGGAISLKAIYQFLKENKINVKL